MSTLPKLDFPTVAHMLTGMIQARCRGCPTLIWRQVDYKPGDGWCDTCRGMVREKLEYLNFERDTNEEQDDE